MRLLLSVVAIDGAVELMVENGRAGRPRYVPALFKPVVAISSRTSDCHRSSSSCVISGYFTLCNGTIPVSTRSFEYSETVVYDTVIKASCGPSMRAKLLISGRHTYPDESVVCIIAKGGPSRPYGFFLRASNILSSSLELPLYRDILRCNRISATGVITSTFRDESEDVLFELLTVSHIDDRAWNWTMRYVTKKHCH